MGAILSLLGGMPRWVYEALAVVALAVGLYETGAYRERVKIETHVEKQQVIVQEKVVETDHTHDAELATLRAYRAAHPIVDGGLCFADSSPPSTPKRSAGAEGGAVQPVPSRDSGVQQIREGRPVIGLLESLAGRADEVSAALRRRQSLEP
jgi:hypothetical protein